MVSIEEIGSFLQGNDIIFVLIVIGATAIAVKIADYILKRISSLTNRTRTDIDDLVIKSIRIPIFIGLILLGARIGLTGVEFLEPYSNLINQLFSVATLALVALIALRIIDVVSVVFSRTWFVQSRADVKSFVTPLSRLAKGVAVLFIGIAAIAIFGIDVDQIIFVWGIIGFAIGLSLQPVLADMFSGLAIISQGTFKVGDRIILNSGEITRIIEIRLQNTLLEDMTTGNHYSISNTDLSKQKVTILHDGVLHVSIPFSIDYDDMKRASDIAVSVGKETDSLSRAPTVNILKLDGKATLDLSLWINDPGRKNQVVTETASRLVNELKKQGIQVH
jgi:small-conductance mechanosensitive channel